MEFVAPSTHFFPSRSFCLPFFFILCCTTPSGSSTIPFLRSLFSSSCSLLHFFILFPILSFLSFFLLSTPHTSLLLSFSPSFLLTLLLLLLLHHLHSLTHSLTRSLTRSLAHSTYTARRSSSSCHEGTPLKGPTGRKHAHTHQRSNTNAARHAPASHLDALSHSLVRWD